MLSFCLQLLIVEIIINCKSQSCVAPNGNNNVKYESTLKSLTNMGYEVIEGNFTFLVVPTEYEADPGSIYGVFSFPNLLTTNEGAWIPFSGCDAVLFTGCTPPKVKYFSFTPYIFESFFPIPDHILNDPNADFIDPEQVLFASLGDSINNLIINSTDYNNWDIDHDSSNNYNSLTTLITTADKQTFNDISSELNKIGLSKTVNLISIPNEYINFVQYDEIGIHTSVFLSINCKLTN